jgi:hypothetical protein
MWCKENNIGVYKFSRYKSNISRFIDFIKKYKEDLSFPEDLMLMRIKATDYKRIYSMGNLAKTMRMTLCEF